MDMSRHQSGQETYSVLELEQPAFDGTAVPWVWIRPVGRRIFEGVDPLARVWFRDARSVKHLSGKGLFSCMERPTPALLGLMALVALAASARGQDGPIGFAPGSRAAQAKAEAHALSVPTPDAARAWLRAITEEPHVAGTPADYKTAVDVRDKLRSWGWQAELAEYEVLLNYPVRSSAGSPLRDRPAEPPTS